MTEQADNAPRYTVRVSELPAEERPRERMLRLGPQALTSAELIAIRLRTGTAAMGVMDVATHLVTQRQGLRGLASMDLSLLAKEHGVGNAKATTIAAAFELGRRLALEGDVLRPQVLNPTDIARLLQAEMELLQQEELRLLTLDTKHQLISSTMLYRGSLNSAPARVAEVFREAVRQNAAAIAVAHNHPSGDPTPSSDDVRFTEAIVEAGHLIEVDVLDHLVFGHGRYISLRERGLGFA